MLLRAANDPGHSQPGRKIRMIGEVVLSFDTESVAQGEIGTDAPVILRIQAGVKPIHANGGIPHGAGADGVFRRPKSTTDQILHSLPVCQTHYQLLVRLDSRELCARAGTGGGWGRSLPGSKRKRSIEIGGLNVVFPVFAQPRSKLQEKFA